MAALTDEQILEEVFPQTLQREIGSGFALTRQLETVSLQTGVLDIYNTQAQCAKAGSYNPAAYAQSNVVAGLQAGGLKGAASGGIRGALSLIPFVGPFLANIFDKINPIAAHAKAVAREQGTLCAIVPQVNANLRQVDSDFAAGNITLPQAFAELDQIEAGYDSGVTDIIKDDGSHCNAACVVKRMVESEIILRKQTYQVPVLGNLTKYWYLWAAGAVALIFVWRD